MHDAFSANYFTNQYYISNLHYKEESTLSCTDWVKFFDQPSITTGQFWFFLYVLFFIKWPQKSILKTFDNS